MMGFLYMKKVHILGIYLLYYKIDIEGCFFNIV